MRAFAAVLLLWATGTPAPVRASEPAAQARIAEGRAIAETWCANCHLVGTVARGMVGDAAPTFRAIAGRDDTTALSLRAFLLTPHGAMPDYRLTSAQIEEVSAWILNLRDR